MCVYVCYIRSKFVGHILIRQDQTAAAMMINSIKNAFLQKKMFVIINQDIYNKYIYNTLQSIVGIKSGKTNKQASKHKSIKMSK